MSIQEELEVLSKQLEESRNVAFQAMNYSSDLGTILLFIEESFSIYNESELIENLLTIISGFNLEAVACGYSCGGKTYTRTAEVTPEERAMIEVTRSQHRIASDGTVTVFNYDHISCLVRNMPTDNEERYGMLKDTIATLLNGVESRLRGIDKEQRIQNTQKALLQLSEQSITELRTHFSHINSNATNVLSKLMSDMKELVTVMGESENSQENVRQMMNSHVSLITQISDHCRSVDSNFADLKRSIDNIADSCEQEALPTPAAAVIKPPAQDNSAGSVDLF